MNDDLTAGEFQAMTGLTTKALRLYAERDIVTPASIDPVSGYRVYSRAQLRHGMTVDLLRRAQVPLSELASAADFSFERWRETVELQRHMEDFYLDVAEHVASFDLGDLTAHSTPAPAVDWVGVVIDLDIPDDAEGRIGTFAQLAVVTPEIERAFAAALEHLGAGPAEVSWTAAPDATRNGYGQMVVARPRPAGLEAAAHRDVADRVRSATDQEVAVISGTLPRRVEVTFTTATARELTPVEEAAAGYLHTLAFEEHIAREGLTAVLPTGRQVVRGPSVFTEDGGGPVSVFDVHPAPRQEEAA